MWVKHLYTRHITRKLYGITLLMPPYCHTTGGNLCNCEYKVLDIWNNSRYLQINIYGRTWLLFNPVSLLFWECWFFQFLKRQCGALLLITLKCEPLFSANYRSGNHVNKYVVIENIVPSPGLVPSQREMSRIVRVSQGAILRHVNESSSLILGLHGHLLKIMILEDQNQVGVDQAKWTHCLCPHSPRTGLSKSRNREVSV